MVDADRLDAILGAWLGHGPCCGHGLLVIAVDGKIVRGARRKGGKAPHLVAAPAHGAGAVFPAGRGRGWPNEIRPGTRCGLSPTWPGPWSPWTLQHPRGLHRRTCRRPGCGLRDDGEGQHAHAVPAAGQLPWAQIPAVSICGHGPWLPPDPAHDQSRVGTGMDRVHRRRPDRAVAAHRHPGRKKTIEVAPPGHQRRCPDRHPDDTGVMGKRSLAHRNRPTGSGTSPTKRTNRWSEPGTRPA